MVRAREGLAALALVLGAAAGASLTGSAQPAHAAVGECPPGWEPVGPGTGGDFFDQNVNVFAGGDFTVTGEAAEAEGVVVSLGDASFQRTTPGTYNVGVVGVGSGVSPNPGTDMLVVGANLSGNANTVIDVGFGIGGNVVVGGTIAPGTQLQTSGGTVTQEVADATAPYDGLPAQIQAKSTAWASLPPTGTAVHTDLPLQTTFFGDNSSDPQVFNVAAADLGTATRQLQFVGIPDGAAIYINVTGGPATLNFSTVLDEAGAEILPSQQAFVDLATHLLWNFPTAADVTINAPTQVPGSIVVAAPTSNTIVSSPGTNGRMYVNGDLTHTGAGSEMHNYPFLPDEDLDCRPLLELGGFTVEKILNDPDGVVDPALEYAGTFTCTFDGADVTPADNTWTTTAGAGPTLVTDQLQVGSTCTLTETPPDPPDPDHDWATPQITPASVTITADTEPVGFTVTNTVTESGLFEPGSFTVQKDLDDPDGVVDPALEYTGTFACTFEGADVTPDDNTWTTTAGAGPTLVASQLIIGSTCTLTETPPEPAPGYEWEPAAIAPDTVTISDDDVPVGFTVTNTARASSTETPTPTPTDPTDPAGPSTVAPGSAGGGLPNTGSPVGLWVFGALGIAMVLAGVLLIPAARGQRAR